MKNFAFRLDVLDLEKGAGDDIAAGLYKLWKESNGIISDELLNYSGFFGVFIIPPDTPNTPQLSYLGEDALAVRLLGSDWHATPRNTYNAMSDNYRSLVGSAYSEAARNKAPHLDLISTAVDLEEDYSQTLKYQRLLLPFSTDNGATFIFSYSQDAGSSPPSKGRTREGESPLFLPQRSKGLSYSELLEGFPR